MWDPLLFIEKSENGQLMGTNENNESGQLIGEGGSIYSRIINF